LKSRVHSGRFMQHVYLTLQSKSNGELCLLNLRWDYTSVWNVVPAGSMVIPKYWFIQDLRKEYSDEMAEGRLWQRIQSDERHNPPSGWSYQ
jgi:hypothetical protein